jgi:hypothetical protein
MKITYTYRGWYVFYYNSKYVAQHADATSYEADTQEQLLNTIDEFMK